MNHKLLNIVCAIAVVIVAAGVICAKQGGKKMINANLGHFPVNILDGAEDRILNAVQTARTKTQELVAQPNKTYMTFVRPLMDIGAELDDVVDPVGHLDGVNNSERTRTVIAAVLPTLSEFSSDMGRHRGIYDGFLEIKKNEYDTLDEAQKRVIDDAIEGFELSGIALAPDKQERLKEIEARESALANDFGNNVIAANTKFKLTVTDEAQLGDMPASDKNAARVGDGWEFSLLGPSYTALIDYATDTKLREQMYHAYAIRAPENEKIIVELLALRQESAKILGFDDYAALAIKTRSAPSADAVQAFLDELATSAKPYAQMEYDALAIRAKKDGVDLKPWDVAFYARLLKQEKYNLSEAETKPYFELNATVDGLFDILQDMFDINFVERDVPLWHESAKYYDVVQNGNVIAGLYMDLETRASKSTGAWVGSYHFHYRDAAGRKHLPEAFLVTNFPAASKDAPSLLTLDNVSTLFHEMGHALHALLSTVDERDVSGTQVDRDVVEFPSQFLESFWNAPAVLKKLGRHYQTGDPIPADLINRIIATDKYNRGMFLVRQLEFGMFDMTIHRTHNLDAGGVQKIYDDIRQKVAVIDVPPYHRQQHGFTHLFAGGYAAGYYSYLWAEVLSADAFVAFDNNPLNKTLARKYLDVILARGGTKKMGDLYREFMGRDPKPDSLLKAYGLK